VGVIWVEAYVFAVPAFGGAIFAGDAFHNGLDAVLYVLFAVGVIAVGVAGAVLSLREGRFLPPPGDESRAVAASG
jgi:hypothetical protein